MEPAGAEAQEGWSMTGSAAALRPGRGEGLVLGTGRAGLPHCYTPPRPSLLGEPDGGFAQGLFEP